MRNLWSKVSQDIGLVGTAPNILYENKPTNVIVFARTAFYSIVAVDDALKGTKDVDLLQYSGEGVFDNDAAGG